MNSFVQYLAAHGRERDRDRPRRSGTFRMLATTARMAYEQNLADAVEPSDPSTNEPAKGGASSQKRKKRGGTFLQIEAGVPDQTARDEREEANQKKLKKGSSVTDAAKSVGDYDPLPENLAGVFTKKSTDPDVRRTMAKVPINTQFDLLHNATFGTAQHAMHGGIDTGVPLRPAATNLALRVVQPPYWDINPLSVHRIGEKQHLGKYRMLRGVSGKMASIGAFVTDVRAMRDNATKSRLGARGRKKRSNRRGDDS